MSTNVDQAYFTWSQEQMTQIDGSTGVSLSQMLDHGSVSFGKFEFESLSWEKWSVFTHDRRQEELEKFNGLVAEKKAYFEEYYRKLRALKALQQQEEQREQAAQRIRSENLRTELSLEYSIDGSVSEEEEEKVEKKMGSEIKEEREEIVVQEENNGEKERLEEEKPLERKAVSKGEPSSSSISSRPRKVLKPKLNPEIRPVSRSSKPTTRHAKQKPTPPPPPPHKTVRKVNSSNLKVKPSRTIPPSSTPTPRSTVPSSSTPVTRTPRSTVPSSSNTVSRTTRSTVASSSNTLSRTTRNTAHINTNTSSNTNLKRPSSSSGGVRRPVSASGARPSVPARRPLSSAGVRERDSKLMREKVPPNSIKSAGPLLNTPRIAIIPRTIKSDTTETKREATKLVKEPLALNNNISVKRTQFHSHIETSKSRSVNLPPKKNTDSTSKMGSSKDTTQTRLNVMKNNPQPARNNASIRNATTPRVVTNSRTETQKSVAPCTSERPRTGTRPQTSNYSSVNGKKPRTEAQKWR